MGVQSVKPASEIPRRTCSGRSKAANSMGASVSSSTLGRDLWGRSSTDVSPAVVQQTDEFIRSDEAAPPLPFFPIRTEHDRGRSGDDVEAAQHSRDEVVRLGHVHGEQRHPLGCLSNRRVGEGPLFHFLARCAPLRSEFDDERRAAPSRSVEGLSRKRGPNEGLWRAAASARRLAARCRYRYEHESEQGESTETGRGHAKVSVRT
jgi:hypothetical protein